MVIRRIVGKLLGGMSSPLAFNRDADVCARGELFSSSICIAFDLRSIQTESPSIAERPRRARMAMLMMMMLVALLLGCHHDDASTRLMEQSMNPFYIVLTLMRFVYCATDDAVQRWVGVSVETVQVPTTNVSSDMLLGFFRWMGCNDSVESISEA